MASLRPKRLPRDITPDWPVDVDRVVRTHRLRKSSHSAARVIWLLSQALRAVGHEVQAISVHVHLSQHELRKKADASGLPPLARARQLDIPLLAWGNRIWALDTSESWKDVLETGHAYLVDSIWDTSKNYLFRTIFSKGIESIAPPDRPRNYQILIDALAETMRELGVRPGNPLPTPPPDPAAPHLNYLQVRDWIEQGEPNQPQALPDVFDVVARSERTQAIWTREDDVVATAPLPMGIFHWPSPAIQAFFKKCQFEEVLPDPAVSMIAPPRLRM